MRPSKNTEHRDVCRVQSDLGTALTDGRTCCNYYEQVQCGGWNEVKSVKFWVSRPSTAGRVYKQLRRASPPFRKCAEITHNDVLALRALGCHSHLMSLCSEKLFCFPSVQDSLFRKCSLKTAVFLVSNKVYFRNFWYFGHLVNQFKLVTRRLIKNCINLIYHIKLVMTQLLLASLLYLINFI